MLSINKLLDYGSIKAVDVFLELKRTREYVGQLTFAEGKYVFIYNDKYLDSANAIPLGPEIPLTQKRYTAEKLFEAFEDRLPSKQNPAYPEYCQMFGIDSNEDNKLILLATIGRKGPSSFIFEPNWGVTFTSKDLKDFRLSLGLSTREFAYCFSQAAIVRIENNQTDGHTILKYTELYSKFPEVALYHILRHPSKLHSKKKDNITAILLKLVNVLYNNNAKNQKIQPYP
jgi:HipA-like protein